jgi:hypothetical protein
LKTIKKISTSFTRDTDANLAKSAGYKVSCLTGNKHFTDPVPNLETLGLQVVKYEADLVAAKGKDRIAVATKNASRKLLEQMLKEMGLYVMYISKGDEEILASTGFTVNKMPEARNITNPGNISLSNGVSSGEIKAMVNAVKNARSYLFEIAKEPPGEKTDWQSFASSRSKFTFKDLTAGKQYWIRIAVIGTGTQISYSAVVNRFAQ